MDVEDAKPEDLDAIGSRTMISSANRDPHTNKVTQDTLPMASTASPPPPPNGGLDAWIQVLGAHFLFFNSWGIVNTFGVYQTIYEESILKDQTPSAISWIGTFQAFLLVVLSAAVGPIFDRGYFRALICTGTFFTVFGLMMTSLATEYWQLFLAQGLCVGLGLGCLFLPSVAIAATYFSTRRALAIGIVASGGSIGSVIYPIVLYRLQSQVGLAWATRIIGFTALVTLALSLAVMKTRLPPPQTARALLDPGAFKNVPFLLFSVGLFLSFAGLYVPIFYIIVWAQRHAQVGTALSFYLLAVLNGSSTFGRIIPGLLADQYGSLPVMIVCNLSAAVLAYVATIVHNLAGLVVFTILYGFMSGAVVSLPSAVIASLTPRIELIGTWMGMSFCFAAAGILVGNPIAGTIINVPQNYFAGGFILSGSLIVAAGALFLLAHLHIVNQRKAADVK